MIGARSMRELEIIAKIKQKIKNHPVVIQMFKDYGIDIDELDLFPICFADIDVSAKTDHGVIFINKKHLEDGDPIDKDDHYLVHEITHVLQQTCGDKPTKGANDGDYLANKYEQEGFQNQSEYIADTRSPEKAEDYIDHVLDYHDVDDKKLREKRKDQLLNIAKIKYLTKKAKREKGLVGYWIDPDGTYIHVPLDHEKTAREILQSKGIPLGTNASREYMVLGAIKVDSYHNFLTFDMETISKQNFEKAQLFVINNNSYNRFKDVKLYEFHKTIELPMQEFIEASFGELHGLKKEASTELDRYLISPDNQYIEIPYEKTHDSVAYSILVKMDEEPGEDPLDIYEKLGAIRVAGAGETLFFEFETLSRQNLTKIQLFIINKNLYNKYKYIRLFGFNNLINITTEELMEGSFQEVIRRNELTKAASDDYDSGNYKYLITPDNKYIQISPNEYHEDSAARELYQEPDYDNFSNVFEYIKQGVIRVTGTGYELYFEIQYFSKKNIERIQSFIMDNGFYNFIKNIRIHSIIGNRLVELPMADLMGDSFAEIANRKVASSLGDNNYKYLISPQNEYIQIPRNKQHEYIAAEILHVGIDHSMNDYIDLGGIRVSGYIPSLSFEFKGFTPRTIDRIKDFLINNNLINRLKYVVLSNGRNLIQVPVDFFMESDVYEILKCNTLKVASLNMKAWWIVPNKDIIEVPANSLHTIAAAEYLDPERTKYDDPEDAVNDLLYSGAIKVKGINNLLSFTVVDLTPDIFETIQDFIINHSSYNNIEIWTLFKSISIPAQKLLEMSFVEIKSRLR